MMITDHILNAIMPSRAPDVIIGEPDDTYLRRWWLIPKNRFFNVYLHHFLRSDDDRAMHDHPWVNASWLLHGSYDEVVPVARPRDDSYESDCRYQFTRTAERTQGAFTVRQATQAHRIVLKRDAAGKERSVWTLFITGPNLRTWGFWCKHGWRRWQDYAVTIGNNNQVGRGCE